MIPDSEHNKARKLPELFLLVTILFSYAYFYHIMIFPNPATRLDLTYSLVLNGKLHIDDYHINTMDKAFVNGHYYCDKAPGLSLAATPFLAALRTTFRSLNFHPDNPLFAYLLTFLCVSLLSTAAFVLLFRIMVMYGAGQAAAMAMTLFFSIGTICFTYATQFYGHMPAAAMCVIALYYFLISSEEGSPLKGRTLFFCGFLCGFAVITDYMAIVPAVAITVLFLLRLKITPRLILFAAGGLVPLAIFLWYNNAAFGSPFSLGYFHEVDPVFRQGIGQSAGGMGIPNPGVALKLLFSPQRGLLWSSPFLVFALWGIFATKKFTSAKRNALLACLLIFLGVLILNAAYYAPYGGYAPGPRFLVLCIPFLAVPVAAAWTNTGKSARLILVALGIVSVIQQFVVNAVEPHIPQLFDIPIWQFSIPMLKQGFLTQNLGALFNLPGLWSFAPLFVVFAIIAVVFFRGYFTEEHSLKPLIISVILSVILFGVFSATGIFRPELSSHKKAYHFSDMWLRRGLAEFRTGNMVAAERSIKQAIVQDPDYVQPYISLAAMFIHYQNKPERALEILSKAQRDGDFDNSEQRRVVDSLIRDARREIEMNRK